MAQRPLNLPELGLLVYLLRGAADAERLLGQLPVARVADITAHGVGSLRFVGPMPERRLGAIAGRTHFLDDDGVPVFVALYLDRAGELYELDCWKADASPVHRIPAF
ncbi:hypothetical protein EJV47_06315 [Hymenobacter gummosus]|uniref:DUF6984 domain-containing protein n=1 Tax=Hymenobacter gummosus TaxID=1776032 RepID=A0A3S0JIM1_9BACT|nr:hypothetical protein [Hymenobacter gummosus]RTQ51414.1 hypothetical protein EJV47_06315 [Hymenobacter gummosus]